MRNLGRAEFSGQASESQEEAGNPPLANHDRYGHVGNWPRSQPHDRRSLKLAAGAKRAALAMFPDKNWLTTFSTSHVYSD